MNKNTMQYDQPNVTILGNAVELIQGDKGAGGESALDGLLSFED